MPKGSAKTKKKKGPKAKRRRSRVDRANTGRDPEHPYVLRGDRVEYVLVPVEEYERLVNADMAREAVKKLDADESEWIDADDLALELAGRRIAVARKAAGLTQKQVGRKLGLPQSQISRIERNPDRTTVRTLKRIAKALKVDVSALL